MNLLYASLASLFLSLISFIVTYFLIFTKGEWSKIVLHYGIPFAAGSILGNVFFHLLPEQISEYGYTSTTSIWIIVGILLMLITEAYFHCSHDSMHELECDNRKHAHLAPLNLMGDGIHNFLDGIAIGAAFLVHTEIGIITTIAIALHELPQEMADVSVLKLSGWRHSSILISNTLVSLTALVGVFVAFMISAMSNAMIPILVAIAIGQFIYIALADLVPEIHTKSGMKKYILEISIFIVGLLLMYVLTNVLPE